MKIEDIEFYTVFDNNPYNKKLQSLWGFSCYIKTPFLNLLFDTGSNGRVLIKNIDKMGLDLKKVSLLFLSHPHWDHIGGLDTVLEENPDLKVIVPESFSKRLIEDLKKISKEIIVVGKEPLQIENGFYSTGTLYDIGEESLVIDCENGGVLIVGCSHPGIVKILKRAIRIINKNILYIIGGFHLLNKNREEVEKISQEIKALGVKYITPIHCSGDAAKEAFEKVFKNGFIKGGVGSIKKLKKI